MYQRVDYEAGLYDKYHKIIFSGNGTFYHVHELVHAYTSPKYKCHHWFDEGIATYFGGNVGRTLDELISIANRIIDNCGFVIPEEVTKLDTINEELRAQYLFGGLLMKIAMEEMRGREDVLYLLDQGKSDEDFYRAVKDIFHVEKYELNAYLVSKIKQYAK